MSERRPLRDAEQHLAAAADRLRVSEPHLAAVVADAGDRVRAAATLLEIRDRNGPLAARQAAQRALRDLIGQPLDLTDGNWTPVDGPSEPR
jgi:hypothetical protein